MGKHPRIRNGLTDEAIIRRWWNQWPEANIGVVTGRESGLIVLDIDPSRGEESIDGYNIPDTAEQLMGRGRQLLFQLPYGDFKLKSATDLRQCSEAPHKGSDSHFLPGSHPSRIRQPREHAP